MELNLIYANLVDTFELKEGDSLFIASDISGLARYFKSEKFAFSVDLFINEIQLRLGNSGTIFIPAYTDYLQNGAIFDYQKSKPSTGALSNKVQRRKDFIRSKDPIHSVFVWGKLQEEFLNLTETKSFGENSVFGFIHRNDTKMIFIDVDFQESFTFVHYLEYCKKVSYRKNYKWVFQLQDGEINTEIQFIFHSKKKGFLTDLIALQDYFIVNQKMKIKEWNQVRIFQLELSQAYLDIESFLKQGKKLHRFSMKEFIRRWGRKIIKNKDF